MAASRRDFFGWMAAASVAPAFIGKQEEGVKVCVDKVHSVCIELDDSGSTAFTTTFEDDKGEVYTGKIDRWTKKARDKES